MRERMHKLDAQDTFL